MYLFYAWLIENKLYTLGETWHVAVCVFVLSIVLAYLCLKLYDEPIRKYLAKRFLSKNDSFIVMHLKTFHKAKKRTPTKWRINVALVGVFYQ